MATATAAETPRWQCTHATTTTETVMFRGGGNCSGGGSGDGGGDNGPPPSGINTDNNKLKAAMDNGRERPEVTVESITGGTHGFHATSF
jgi:hypothetical protein